MLDGFSGTDIVYWVPFEVWNITTNQQVSLAVYDWQSDGIWDPDDLLAIVNYPYDSIASVTAIAFPSYYSWMFGFDTSVYNPSVGDVFTIEGAPLNGPGDIFSFSVDAVNVSMAKNSLKDVRVVPNPYFVEFSSLVERNEGASAIHFRSIPDICTIRIYTMAGDLVQTIRHTDGTGLAEWNLLSSNGQQAASGIYLYNINSPYGEHSGRFAIVK